MRKTPKNPIVKKIVEMIGDGYGATKQFAAKADVDIKVLYDNIYRDITPDVPTLINISRAYGVSLDELCADYPTERRFTG
jgi:hypothetical protein